VIFVRRKAGYIHFLGRFGTVFTYLLASKYVLFPFTYRCLTPIQHHIRSLAHVPDTLYLLSALGFRYHLEIEPPDTPLST